MTGYARAEGGDNQGTWLWEAKSVNGRGLDVRLRLPPGHDWLEPVVREAVAKHLKRGNVQVSLTVSRIGDTGPVRINQAFLEQILNLCQDWQTRFPQVAPPRWDGLLGLKGVIEASEGSSDATDDTAVRESREAAIKATLDQALIQLAAMRDSEGGRLTEVLGGQLTDIVDLVGRASQCESLRPEAVKARMMEQVTAVLEAAPALTDERIAQEIALIAVKADIREEIDRLKAHVVAARQLIGGGGVVGRKLDFLAQEFNREANTLCSKSADVELTRVGLDLKAVIDQFREQVQNIE